MGSRFDPRILTGSEAPTQGRPYGERKLVGLLGGRWGLFVLSSLSVSVRKGGWHHASAFLAPPYALQRLLVQLLQTWICPSARLGGICIGTHSHIAHHA